MIIHNAKTKKPSTMSDVWISDENSSFLDFFSFKIILFEVHQTLKTVSHHKPNKLLSENTPLRVVLPTFLSVFEMWLNKASRVLCMWCMTYLFLCQLLLTNWTLRSRLIVPGRPAALGTDFLIGCYVYFRCSGCKELLSFLLWKREVGKEC